MDTLLDVSHYPPHSSVHLLGAIWKVGACSLKTSAPVTIPWEKPLVTSLQPREQSFTTTSKIPDCGITERGQAASMEKNAQTLVRVGTLLHYHSPCDLASFLSSVNSTLLNVFQNSGYCLIGHISLINFLNELKDSIRLVKHDFSLTDKSLIKSNLSKLLIIFSTIISRTFPLQVKMAELESLDLSLHHF